MTALPIAHQPWEVSGGSPTLSTVTETLTLPRSEGELEQYRVELTGYCYRMLGSSFDAADAVQETMVRAWRSLDKFEGRSSLRSWLYRIATNVCLTSLDGRQRRPRPMDLGPSSRHDIDMSQLKRDEEIPWLEPIPDAQALPSAPTPEEATVLRETIRLAFVAALQHLPARQRAVLILREVLGWKAEEVATLLETSVASVNSALQRARATLDERRLSEVDITDTTDKQQQELVDKWVETFESYDMKAFVTMLHEDVVMSMPPYDLWLEGPDNVIGWMLGHGNGCEGSRLVPTIANGRPAFGQYRKDPEGGHSPWALQIIDFKDGKIVDIVSFLDTPHYFPMFGLPAHLD